jgi:hypothetical protein
LPPEHISKLAERFLSLFAALGATSGFVAVRDGLELEEAPFLVALVGFCTLAAVAAATASYAVHRRVGASLVSGGLAAILVPLLYVGYLALRLLACLTGDDICYS